MNKYCKTFVGGFCKKVKMYVPRNWCLDVCRGSWKDGNSIQIRKGNELSYLENLPSLELDAKRQPAVIKEKVSVIIATRNEKPEHLNKTIESVLANAEGDVEIVVAFDSPEKQDIDKRVRWIKFSESVGRRVAINEAVKLRATGKYLLHLDAHCTMSKGWDTKMKVACRRKTIVVPILKSLTDNFEDKSVNLYTFVKLNKDYICKWYSRYKHLSECERLEKTPAFTGCGWMIRRNYFNKLGGCAVELGHYGFCGEEWSVKADKILLRTDVFCGHIFSTNAKHKNYPTIGTSPDGFKQWVETNYPNAKKKTVIIEETGVMPSNIKMAGSFGKNAIKYLAAGAPNRTDEERQKLEAICEDCDFYIAKSKFGKRCKKCGCCIGVKTLWATAHCPIDKW